METQCLKIKLKSGTKDKVREWCNTFREHDGLDYVLEQETVVVETLFLDEQADGDYLIFYLKAESLQQANDFLTKESHALNDLSKAFMQECWDLPNAKALEMILDVHRIKEVGVAKLPQEKET